MAELTGAQRRRLEELGREPISLPAEIFFAGNEQKQREKGTYNHPNLVRNRLRIAMDRLERARKEVMSDTERGKIGVSTDQDAALVKLENDVRQAQKDLAAVLGMKMEEEIAALNLSDDKIESESKTETTTATSVIAGDATPKVVAPKKKAPGRPKKAVVTALNDDLSSN